MRLLDPWQKVENLAHINLDNLQMQGMDTLLLDMDNTVVPWHTFDIDASTYAWVSDAKARGFKICIISNNQKWRIKRLTAMMGVEGVWNACKPMLGGYIKALKVLGSNKTTSVFVGDQLFTDILGANILGLKTILVMPLTRREFLWTRIMRRLETLVTGRAFGRKAAQRGSN